MMNEKEMMQVFEEYEKTFGEWLYSAWDFDIVDWVGLAKVAEKCIQQNEPMTDEIKSKYIHLDDDKIY